ncbi:uncharacterized protein LY89DRAFT_783906 [Mollisia scopiformis]|uniref:Uncharacterized protein n=1 Tax=Mollisia scopiformis TaxID=149040 RepID=A0A194X446_MOLSC|nr:uncharacterized protein LY89DRAFT_783906 [Mollisia scopiformis]KUJ14829.1 hypothetical protein LY89DRAFT_783906 [Mollisia scopiformis]
MSSNSSVYTGLWTNHSKGAILGKTLTVSPRSGLILVAVLALFVSLAGSQSWGIIRFLAHQFRVKPWPQHAIFLQQQAVLRNTSAASAGIWQFGLIGWAWRSQGVKSFRKSFSLLLLGVSHLVLFTTAGILSSSLAKVNNEILVRSSYCGTWIPNNDDTSPEVLAERTDWFAHRRENADLSKGYVRDCLNGYESSPQCNMFKRRIPFQIQVNASCPFSPEMCLAPTNGSLLLDTGFLHSRDDFGINSKSSDTILYRKIMSCSPVVTEGYTTSGSSTFDGRSYNYTATFYGPNRPLTSYPAFPSWGGIAAIPELVSSNGSVVLIFAASTGHFLKASDDLWLSAHRPGMQELISDAGILRNESFYGIDKPISVLGCTEQHQFCNLNRPENTTTRCTPQADLMTIDSLNISEFLDTQHQYEVTNMISEAVGRAELGFVVGDLSPPLLAMEYLMKQSSGPIATNQWVLEATNWFSTGINVMQRSLAEVATGPSGRYAKYTANTAANDTELQRYCDNLILRDNGYTSFSVLAIGLVLGLGGFIIVSSLFFEAIIGWAQMRWKRGLRHKVYWNLDSALQLQRMAFEEAGLGTWDKCTEDVPVVTNGEKSRVASEWDEWHPTIVGKEPLVELHIHPEAVKPEEAVALESPTSEGLQAELSRDEGISSSFESESQIGL